MKRWSLLFCFFFWNWVGGKGIKPTKDTHARKHTHTHTLTQMQRRTHAIEIHDVDDLLTERQLGAELAFGFHLVGRSVGFRSSATGGRGADHQVKMCATLLRRHSTTRFCCIMSSARLNDSVAAHVMVGPKTMARLDVCMRLCSRYSVILTRCFSRNLSVSWFSAGSVCSSSVRRQTHNHRQHRHQRKKMNCVDVLFRFDRY